MQQWRADKLSVKVQLYNADVHGGPADDTADPLCIDTDTVAGRPVASWARVKKERGSASGGQGRNDPEEADGSTAAGPCKDEVLTRTDDWGNVWRMLMCTTECWCMGCGEYKVQNVWEQVSTEFHIHVTCVVK